MKAILSCALLPALGVVYAQITPINTPPPPNIPNVAPNTVISRPPMAGRRIIRVPGNYATGPSFQQTFPLIPASPIPVAGTSSVRASTPAGSFPPPSPIVQPITNYPPQIATTTAPISAVTTPVNPNPITIGTNLIQAPAAPIGVGSAAVTQSGSVATPTTIPPVAPVTAPVTAPAQPVQVPH